MIDQKIKELLEKVCGDFRNTDILAIQNFGHDISHL